MAEKKQFKAESKRLLDLMGGKIVVQSIYGEGSRFTVAIDQRIIKKEKIEAGIPIRTRGQHRKNSEPKNIIAEQAYEIQRLKMENDLLRDFLRFAERR